MSEKQKIGNTAMYQMININSISEDADWMDLKNVISQIANGYAVLWQHHAVFSGIVENGTVRWLRDEMFENADEHIVRLRLFNDEAEYHFWREGTRLKGRIRKDGEGREKCDIIETAMLLRGVIGGQLRKLTEFNGKNKLRILTRNYIGYQPETGQAGYVDSRFVKFI